MFLSFIKVVNDYPEKTKPKFYRFAIYLSDTNEPYVLSVLDRLPSKFQGGRIVLKLDKSTKEGRFGSRGHQKISKNIYRLGKYDIQKQYVLENGYREYRVIEGMFESSLIQLLL